MNSKASVSHTCPIRVDHTFIATKTFLKFSTITSASIVRPRPLPSLPNSFFDHSFHENVKCHVRLPQTEASDFDYTTAASQKMFCDLPYHRENPFELKTLPLSRRCVSHTTSRIAELLVPSNSQAIMRNSKPISTGTRFETPAINRHITYGEHKTNVKKRKTIYSNRVGMLREHGESCGRTHSASLALEELRNELEKVKSQLARSRDENQKISMAHDSFLNQIISIQKQIFRLQLEMKTIQKSLEGAKMDADLLQLDNRISGEHSTQMSDISESDDLEGLRNRYTVSKKGNGSVIERAEVVHDVGLDKTRTHPGAVIRTNHRRSPQFGRSGRKCKVEKAQEQWDVSKRKNRDSSLIHCHHNPGQRHVPISLVRGFLNEQITVNKGQNFCGNPRVFCRVRPLKYRKEQTESLGKSALRYDEVCRNKRIHACGKVFEFDHVFNATSTQNEVYERITDLVVNVVNGSNACILTYGQTGSGKTFTMLGTENDRGLSYRALRLLFEVAHLRKDFKVSVSISMLEIYNESLRDLLIPKNKSKGSKLEIRRDPKGISSNAVHVPNLTEMKVFSVCDAWNVMKQGIQNRRVEKTEMNEHSSRSHLIARIMVKCMNLESGAETFGWLSFVDLAGSDGVSRSNASGHRLREMHYINKSLSSLNDVFSALVGHSKHIPYRNSRLTYLLQDCIGCSCETVLFVNVSCDEDDIQETLSSLMFAQTVFRFGVDAKRQSKLTCKVSTATILRGLSSHCGQTSQKSSGGKHGLQQQQQQMQMLMT